MFIANINEEMTPAEQVRALMDEALSLTKKPKGSKKHSQAQINKVKQDIARFFPDLSSYL